MMSILISILNSRATWIFVLITLIIGIFGIQQSRINHLKRVVISKEAAILQVKAELAAAKTTVMQFKLAYDNLAATVENQNAAITQLELQVKERMERAQNILKQLQREQIKTAELTKKLTVMELVEDECTALRQLIDTYAIGM